MKELFYIEGITSCEESNKGGFGHLIVDRITGDAVDALSNPEKKFEFESLRTKIPLREGDIPVVKNLEGRFLITSKNSKPSLEALANGKPGGNTTLARKIKAFIIATNADLEKKSRNLNESYLSPNRKKWFYCPINVGNGDCTVIISPDLETFVFDFGYENQSALKKLYKLWDFIDRSEKVKIERKISGFGISHPDIDHYSGCVFFLKHANFSRKNNQPCIIFCNYKMSYGGTAWAKTKSKIAVLAKNPNFCVVKMPLLNSPVPSVHFTAGLIAHYLWPYEDRNLIFRTSKGGISTNNSSIALLIEDNFGIRANLFGDIESFAWQRVNRRINALNLYLKPRKHIFKFSHHGAASGNMYFKSNSIPGTVNEQWGKRALYTFTSYDPNSMRSFTPCRIADSFSPYNSTSAVNGYVCEFDGAKTKVNTF